MDIKAARLLIARNVSSIEPALRTIGRSDDMRQVISRFQITIDLFISAYQDDDLVVHMLTEAPEDLVIELGEALELYRELMIAAEDKANGVDYAARRAERLAEGINPAELTPELIGRITERLAEDPITTRDIVIEQQELRALAEREATDD